MSQFENNETIERTFEQVPILTGSLSEKEQQVVKEGFDEQSLALFDLLLKPNLDKKDIARIKKAAIGLYETLKAELTKIQHSAAKLAMRDEIKVTITIKNHLLDETTGLPESSDGTETYEKADEVFTYLLVSPKSNTALVPAGTI